LAKVGNTKWPPGGCLSMKTMHIFICSIFYKNGRILFKFGTQVSTGYDIIYNGNRVTGNSNNPNMGNFGRQGDTYAVIGNPVNI
jgi:hypothetical protein